MSHAKIDRRSLIAGGAAAGTAVALGAGKALALPQSGGEMAELIRAYLAEYDAIEAWWITAPDDDATEAEFNEKSDINGERIERVLGMPVRSPDDALAALEWIRRQGVYHYENFGFPEYNQGLFERVSAHLLDATRDYLAGRAA